jgi:methionine-rich copper-binding protein CopC
MRRRALAGVLVAMLAPAIGEAHAVLVKSSPARRAVVAVAPPRIELTFNERLEPAYSTVSVWTDDNRRVDDGKVVVGPEDPRRLTVGVPPVPAGTYTVKFRVLSVDGHIVEGTFPFEVRRRP